MYVRIWKKGSVATFVSSWVWAIVISVTCSLSKEKWVFYVSQTVCGMHQLTCQIANLFFMIELLHVKPLRTFLEAWSWLAFFSLSGERSNPFRLVYLPLFQMHAMCKCDSGKDIHTHRHLYDIRHYNTHEFRFPNRIHRERLRRPCVMLPDTLFTWYIIESLSRNGACIMHDVVINTTLHINYSFLAEETL